MSISTALMSQIPGSLADERVIAATESHYRLRCQIASAGALAIEVLELSVETGELAAADSQQLQEISAELTNRVTYLLEPIGPIEVDQDRCVVQLRSTPPSKDGSARSYYELLVRQGGGVSLKRYRQDGGPPREGIVATLTREVLARLADDMVAAMQHVLDD